MNIMDMLSGDIVHRREPKQRADGLGAMLAFLSQSGQAPTLPQQQQHSSGLGSALLQKFIGDKMAQSTAADAAAERAAIIAKGGNPMNDFAGSQYADTSATGLAMLNDFYQPRTAVQPHYGTMGSSDKPEYLTNYMMTDNGPQAFGNPWKPGSAVQLNMQDRLPPPSAGYRWNPQGTEQSYIPGGPEDPASKQPTAAADTSTKFGTGMADSSTRIKEALSAYNIEKSSARDRTARFLGSGYGDVADQLSNAIKSPARRQLDQATSEFRQFALTAMTGAAYSQDQKDDAIRAMIPTDSDDDAILATKEAARDDFTRTMLQSGMPMQQRTAKPEASTGEPQYEYRTINGKTQRRQVK